LTDRRRHRDAVARAAVDHDLAGIRVGRFIEDLRGLRLDVETRPQLEQAAQPLVLEQQLLGAHRPLRLARQLDPGRLLAPERRVQAEQVVAGCR
jgi:hypothetical protein